MLTNDERFSMWLETLRLRALERLTFREIRRGVEALSRIYVEERERIESAVFDGAGKRAAFACFYTPLHFLLVAEIVRVLRAGTPPPNQVLDLGCGLGAAGAAWAMEAGGVPSVIGVERHKWAAAEARRSLKTLGLSGRVLTQSIQRAPRPRRGDAVVTAFVVNELPDDARRAFLEALLKWRSTSVLIIEPIARRSNRWWPQWRDAFVERSGRADEWRFPIELPDWLAELDRAAGLRHNELLGKSLFLPNSL